MRKLLGWLTRDDVARTNAAQASVRLQHRRHDRDDIDAYLAEYTRAHEVAGAGRLATSRHAQILGARSADGARKATSMVPSPGQPADTHHPPEWAVDQAADDLYDVHDPAVIAEYARELARAAQERADERHDEYDDPDRGGEA
jgi:hypothetical protein